MKLTFGKWTALPVMVLLLGDVALAQDPASSGSSNSQAAPATAPDPTIHQRKENQQDRIANGIQSGQLTAGETSKLETKEAAVNGEIKADRAANGGKLTPAERAKVNRQQNRLSKQIYNDKHNANTAHYGNNEVGQRRQNQQQQARESQQQTAPGQRRRAQLENARRGQRVDAHPLSQGQLLEAGCVLVGGRGRQRHRQ